MKYLMSHKDFAGIMGGISGQALYNHTHYLKWTIGLSHDGSISMEPSTNNIQSEEKKEVSVFSYNSSI